MPTKNIIYAVSGTCTRWPQRNFTDVASFSGVDIKPLNGNKSNS